MARPSTLTPGTAVTPARHAACTLTIGCVLATDDPTAWVAAAAQCGAHPSQLARMFGPRRAEAGLVPVRYTTGVAWARAADLRIVIDV